MNTHGLPPKPITHGMPSVAPGVTAHAEDSQPNESINKRKNAEPPRIKAAVPFPRPHQSGNHMNVNGHSGRGHSRGHHRPGMGERQSKKRKFGAAQEGLSTGACSNHQADNPPQSYIRTNTVAYPSKKQRRQYHERNSKEGDYQRAIADTTALPTLRISSCPAPVCFASSSPIPTVHTKPHASGPSPTMTTEPAFGSTVPIVQRDPSSSENTFCRPGSPAKIWKVSRSNIRRVTGPENATANLHPSASSSSLQQAAAQSEQGRPLTKTERRARRRANLEAARMSETPTLDLAKLPTASPSDFPSPLVSTRQCNNSPLSADRGREGVPGPLIDSSPGGSYPLPPRIQRSAHNPFGRPTGFTPFLSSPRVAELVQGQVTTTSKNPVPKVDNKLPTPSRSTVLKTVPTLTPSQSTSKQTPLSNKPVSSTPALSSHSAPSERPSSSNNSSDSTSKTETVIPQRPPAVPPTAPQTRIKSEPCVTPLPPRPQEEEAPRLVKKGARFYPDVPKECRVTHENHQAHRKAWAKKESSILKSLGLGIKVGQKVIFRDDGMVLEWSSEVSITHADLQKLVEDKKNGIQAELTSNSGKDRKGKSKEISEPLPIALPPRKEALTQVPATAAVPHSSQALPGSSKLVVPHSAPNSDLATPASQSTSRQVNSPIAQSQQTPETNRLDPVVPPPPIKPEVIDVDLEDDESDLRVTIINLDQSATGEKPGSWALKPPHRTRNEEQAQQFSGNVQSKPRSAQSGRRSVPDEAAQLNSPFTPPQSTVTLNPHNVASLSVTHTGAQNDDGREAHVSPISHVHSQEQYEAHLAEQPQLLSRQHDYQMHIELTGTVELQDPPAVQVFDVDLDESNIGIVRQAVPVVNTEVHRVNVQGETSHRTQELSRCSRVVVDHPLSPHDLAHDYILEYLETFDWDRSALAPSYARDATFSFRYLHRSPLSTDSIRGHSTRDAFYCPFLPPSSPLSIGGVVIPDVHQGHLSILRSLSSFGPYTFSKGLENDDVMETDVIVVPDTHTSPWEDVTERGRLVVTCYARVSFDEKTVIQSGVVKTIGKEHDTFEVTHVWLLRHRTEDDDFFSIDDESKRRWPLVALSHQMVVMKALDGDVLERVR